MNELQNLQLSSMVQTASASDQTDLIRTLQHSQRIRADINRMIELKAESWPSAQELDAECMLQCTFLHKCYPDIYIKLRKDELNIGMMNSLLDVLRQIETGSVDQHEGSVLVGTILKEMYVDSALKKAGKLDAANATAAPPAPAAPRAPVRAVTYKEFKAAAEAAAAEAALSANI